MTGVVPAPPDPAALRARLAAERGPRFWRTLEELAETPELRALVAREFPRQAAAWPASLSRRRFLSLMGASLALGGLGGCASPPGETIVPYVRQPEHVVPGRPLFYATALTLSGAATGVLVESHQGRPTKVEGNPDHPAGRGATDPFSQAAVLSLYDPDRATAVTSRGEVRPWESLVLELRRAVEAQRARRGAGLRILTETVVSPTLAHQLETVLAAFPEAGWHQWEPLGPSPAALAGARLAFGRDVRPRYRLDLADVVVALDADVLTCTPATLRYVSDFAGRRRAPDPAAPVMNRLYVVEAVASLTGAVADHRLALRAGTVAACAGALARALGVEAGALAGPPPEGTAGWIAAAARDLQAHRGRGLVVAGDRQPPEVHALAHAMNAHLDDLGRTVVCAEPVEARPVDQLRSLAHLVDDAQAGRVEVLLILGGNPVYTAPADLAFAAALERVALSVHLGPYRDETAVRCRWHVPETHPLEAWSDTRAWDGTVSIVQPLIAPLYQAVSAHELLAVLTDEPLARGYDVVRAYWRGRHGDDDFETFWRRALHDGLVPGTAAPEVAVDLRPDWAAAAARAAGERPTERGGLEIVFTPDPTVWDGRFANNGWLQELPKPLSKITWDNAALLAPATARRLGVDSEDVVELVHRGRRVRAPAWIQPGQADGVVSLSLGYGRTLAGRVGNGLGADACALRTSAAPWFDGGLELRKTGTRRRLAVTARHHGLEGREPVVATTLDALRRDPGAVQARTARERPGPGRRPLTLYPEVRSQGYAWGMAVDLTACVGCNACVVACYAENNIPVVGREQVRLGRIMQWLRIDTYYTGDPDRPTTYHQPLACVHCEQAPCEVVCPVAATVHSAEGLNEMVYNRCIGTRYCSNNCPYKVRRFNFLQYADWRTESLKLQRNPDVTVRSRGVMEKCTYCVQRISRARIDAEREGRRIRDGEVVTACQAACPTGAIVFGDLSDPRSRVRALKASPLTYSLLGDLGTRPRTTYLAAVRNPGPDREPA